jgi:hypothetical protein
VCFVEYVTNISAELQYHSVKVMCFDGRYKRVAGGSECQNILAVGMHVLRHIECQGSWSLG